MTSAQVCAAGGVVWRSGGGEDVEVLVVHRPRYDDWSFPKGKLDGGEAFEQAALREVLEETGLRCELGTELARSRYEDGKRRQKLVRYWAMRVLDGAFEPNEEVDEVRWLRLSEAGGQLTYERDLEVLASFGEAVDARPVHRDVT